MNAISVLGPKFTFSHLAAEVLIDKLDPSLEVVLEPNFPLLFDSIGIKTGLGLLPLQNNLEGPIHDTVRHLQRRKSRIIGEIHFPVRHILMSNYPINDSSLEERTVCSHVQALGQCSAYLDEQRSVNRVQRPSTAEAAHYIATRSEARDFLAIASMEAARAYGLHVVEDNIQNNFQNLTRFLITCPIASSPAIGQRLVSGEYGMKATVIYDIPSASLHRVLGLAASYNFRTTQTITLPSINRPKNSNVFRNETFSEMIIYEMEDARNFPSFVAEVNGMDLRKREFPQLPNIHVIGLYPNDKAENYFPRQAKPGN